MKNPSQRGWKLFVLKTHLSLVYLSHKNKTRDKEENRASTSFIWSMNLEPQLHNKIDYFNFVIIFCLGVRLFQTLICKKSTG